MSNLSTIEKILAMLTVVLLLNFSTKKIDREQPAPKNPLPPKIQDLGLTLEEFTASYNQNVRERNIPQLLLTNIETEQGGEFGNKFNQGFWLLGTTDKTTGKINQVIIAKALMLSGADRKAEIQAAGMAFLLVVKTLSPELTAEERAAIIDGFSSRPYSSVTKGNVKYSSLLMDNGSVINLAAEAKDL